jgi:hypothetical protein
VSATFRARWARPLILAVTTALAIYMIIVWALVWGTFERRGLIGVDFDTFLAFAQRWLDTGSMYLPAQLAGPFDPRPQPHIPGVVPSMYPPHAVLLFAPFLVLPSVLFWAIPLGVLAYAVRVWRPAVWTWPLIVAILTLPETFHPVIVGGSTMWMVAAVAGGLLWGWPALLITLKPSMAPFVLVGIHRRSWWLAALIVGVMALAFGSLWLDYVTVVRNAQADLTYSVGAIPVMLLPVLMWFGSTTRVREPGHHRGPTFTAWQTLRNAWR